MISDLNDTVYDFALRNKHRLSEKKKKRRHREGQTDTETHTSNIRIGEGNIKSGSLTKPAIFTLNHIEGKTNHQSSNATL